MSRNEKTSAKVASAASDLMNSRELEDIADLLQTAADATVAANKQFKALQKKIKCVAASALTQAADKK